MGTRTYEQLCPVAVSLDLVGDRWTLLLLRDLLWHGPMRFGELEDRNPGLSTSLLAVRLNDLAAAGLVERIGGARAGHYRLTGAGLRIRPVVDALYEFGGPLLAGVALRPELLGYVVRTAARRRRRELLQLQRSAVVRLDVDGCEAVVAAGPGRLVLAEDGEPGLDATLHCSQEAFVELLAGTTAFEDAVTSGSAVVDGELAAAALITRLLVPDAS